MVRFIKEMIIMVETSKNILVYRLRFLNIMSLDNPAEQP